jgi:hypothetical protein
MEGKTLYFGEIGASSKTMINYFERNGARSCKENENPAEWMLEITSNSVSAVESQDWPAIWKGSEERQVVKRELAKMREDLFLQPLTINEAADPNALKPFAATFGTQFWIVLRRAFQQYWRTPSYLYSKVALCLFSVGLR